MEGVRRNRLVAGGDAQARIVEPSAEAPFETKRLEQAPAVSAMYANTRLRTCMKSEPSRYIETQNTTNFNLEFLLLGPRPRPCRPYS